MSEVRVAGGVMTQFAKFPESSIRSLADEAVTGALGDAGVTAAEVGITFFSNATAGVMTGQEMIRGQVALRHSGLLGGTIVNVENACASATTAFHMACMAVESGAVDVALAVGAEKLTHEEKGRALAAIGTAVDLSQLDELQSWTSGGSLESFPASGPATGQNRSFFMDIYAANTREYMQRTGATAEDFANVAVKNRRHAAVNPLAQYREIVTVDDVLSSGAVSAPLTRLMCSPIGDGAAAIVVCSETYARRMGRKIRVRGRGLVSGTDRGSGEAGAVERAAARAYESAALGPDDLDIVEVHDAAAPAELMTYEELGLCKEGEAAGLLASGDTALGGKRPVNTSGGLLSKGHPIGATGCGQIVELLDQLRGRCGERQVDGVQVALAENGGGFLGSDPAAMAVTILSY